MLAEALGCKGSEVVLLSGEAARDKRFLVVGLSPAELSRRVLAALPAVRVNPTG